MGAYLTNGASTHRAETVRIAIYFAAQWAVRTSSMRVAVPDEESIPPAPWLS